MAEHRLHRVGFGATGRQFQEREVGGRREVTPTAPPRSPPPAKSGEPYVQLGWGEAGAAGAAYLPHVVRGWFARARFDGYSKDDAAARAELRAADPFGSLVSVRRDVR